MKTIATKHGELLLDDDDYDLLKDYSITTVDTGGYIRCTLHISLPRFLMGRKKFDEIVVDHINGNPLDNRRENLRSCTHAENMRNSKNRKTSKSSSKYRGVYLRVPYWNSPKGQRTNYYNQAKWRAMIHFNKEPIVIGYFNNEETAAYMYDYFAVNLHGQYARTNGLYTPPSPEQFGLRESA